MTGYIVEIDAEIEETLTHVMPGVKWQTWKPYFVPESEDLVGTWSTIAIQYLNGLDDTVDRIFSRSLKKSLKADRVHPSTWKQTIQTVTKQDHSSKESTGDGPVSVWRLEGQSLVRDTVELYGFAKELPEPM